MTSSKKIFTLVALAFAWLGTAGCDQWPFNAVNLDPSQTQSAGGAGGKTSDPIPPPPPGTKGDTAGAPDPGTKGDTAGAPGCDEPPAPASDAGECKVSADASGVPCKICVDGAGKIVYDGCSSGAAGSGDPKGDPSGTAGSGGTAPAPVKCDSTTDPKTGSLCKTCWAADGTVTESDCAPPSQPGTSASCTASTDPKTGQLCKVCLDEAGEILFTDCSSYGG